MGIYPLNHRLLSAIIIRQDLEQEAFLTIFNTRQRKERGVVAIFKLLILMQAELAYLVNTTNISHFNTNLFQCTSNKLQN